MSMPTDDQIWEAVRGIRQRDHDHGHGSEPMRHYSLAEIADQIDGEEVKWLIKGLWVSGGYGAVAGGEKTLKSYLTILLALSIASGETIPGTPWAVDPAGQPVVVFTGEGGRKLWLRRARHLGRILGLNRQQVDALPIMVSDDIQALDSQSFEDALRVHVEVAPKPGLVIIDPFYTYQGEDGGSAGNVHVAGPKLARVSKIVSVENGVALMIVNHFTKAGKDSLNLGSITQAGFREWVHTWILMRHRKAARVDQGLFELEMRYGSREGFGKDVYLSWDIGPFDEDTLEHTGDPSFVLSAPIISQTSAALAEPLVKSVMKFIQANDEKDSLPLSRTAIRNSGDIGGTPGAREKALDTLIKENLVRPEPFVNPSNGRTYEGYRRVLAFENELADSVAVEQGSTTPADG